MKVNLDSTVINVYLAKKKQELEEAVLVKVERDDTLGLSIKPASKR